MGFKVPYEYLPNLGGLQSGDIIPVLRDPVNEGSATMLDVRDYVKPYKVFVGLLNQSGTSAPAVNEYENTLGATITTTYVATKEYQLNADAACFTDADSTWVMIGTNSNQKVFGQEWIDDQTIKITADADGDLFNVPIEIRVYNYAP